MAKHSLPPLPASPRLSDDISLTKTPNADSRTASGSDAAAGPNSDQGSPVFSTLNAGRTGPLNFGKPPLHGCAPEADSSACCILVGLQCMQILAGCADTTPTIWGTK